MMNELRINGFKVAYNHRHYAWDVRKRAKLVGRIEILPTGILLKKRVGETWQITEIERQANTDDLELTRCVWHLAAK